MSGVPGGSEDRAALGRIAAAMLCWILFLGGAVAVPFAFGWDALIAGAPFFGARPSATLRAESATDLTIARVSASTVLVLVLALVLALRFRGMRSISGWIVIGLTAPICVLLWTVRVA